MLGSGSGGRRLRAGGKAEADLEAMIRGGINITLFVRGAPRCLRERPGR